MSRHSHVVHWAARYDLLVWLLTFGRERSFREKLLAPARLQAGESVLDVGCGTGTLAIAASRRVGPSGSVMGMDASPEMIERARSKARKAGLAITFEIARVEALPLPDARFDVVLSTVMLHHVPRELRPDAMREMRRVLKPGGRVLVVDFGGSFSNRHTLVGHLHRHARVKADDLAGMARDAGLDVVENGDLGMWELQYVLAQAPRQ